MVSFTLVYKWIDNNGKQAKSRAYTGPGITYAGAVNAALSLASAMEAISSATLLSVEIRATVAVTTAPVPLLSSDVKRYALLFYRNGEDCASVRVPSPAILLAETSGLYAGVRVTRERLAVLALLAQVEALPAGTLDALGRPYGTAFTVGGIVNL